MLVTTSAIIGVLYGCGLELKAPMSDSVSCQYAVSSMGPCFLPTYFPMLIFVAVLLKAKVRILVINPDLGSIVFAA